VKRALLLVCIALRAQPPVTLVDNGVAKAVVMAGDREAAAELTRYVEKVTGANLPLSGKLPARILVGLSACPPDVQARVRQLGRDGYLIETQAGSTLVLAGNGRDGTAFAIGGSSDDGTPMGQIASFKKLRKSATSVFGYGSAS
jgi:hypothetical protein